MRKLFHFVIFLIFLLSFAHVAYSEEEFIESDYAKPIEKTRQSNPEITFDAQSYTISDNMKITVIDDFINQDPNAKEIVGIKISSSTNPDGGIYELAETGADSGIFAITLKVRDLITKQGLIALHYTYYNASENQKILSSSAEVMSSAPAALQASPAAKKENNHGASFTDYKGTVRVNHNLRKGWNMIQAKNWVDLGSCKGKLWGGYIFSPASNKYFGGPLSGNQLDFSNDIGRMANEAKEAPYYHLSNQAGGFVYAYEDCDMTIELHDKPGDFVFGRGWNFFVFQPYMVGKSFGEALGHCRYSDFVAYNAWSPDGQKWFWEQNNYLKGPFADYEGLDDTVEILESAVGVSYMIYVPEACSLAPLSIGVILADEEASEEDVESILAPDISVSTKSDEEKEKIISKAKGQFGKNKTACVEIDKDKKLIVTKTKKFCDDNDPTTSDYCHFGGMLINARKEPTCLHKWSKKFACEYSSTKIGDSYKFRQNCPDEGTGTYSACAWSWISPKKRVCVYWKWGKSCKEIYGKSLKKYLGSCDTASIGAILGTKG